LAPRIEGIVAELLDAVAGRGGFELIEALAFPLPAIVIAELLGVPAADRERFKHWSQQLSGLVFGAVERGGRDRSASLAAAEFTGYFEDLIRERESTPRDDLISAMVSAADDLSRQELVGACTMLLFGGHETTTGLIANGMARLLEHPAEVERLRADPSLARSAVEEFLRFEGPATAMVRYVAQPFEWQSHRLEAGQRVYLAIAGANRDPSVFRDPDRFDVGRDPNPHLGFGHGRHFCLGAALARLETRIALEALLERFPRLAIRANDLSWGSSVIGRRVATLPLKVD
jgi:cytochrome P450